MTAASATTDPVIVGGARTPFTRLLGAQASLSAVELGTSAIRGALERSGVGAESVDTVLMGQVVQAGAGQNPARQSAIAAGIGRDVPAMTINKVCLSGLAAIIDAARLVRLGEASVVVAGGQESMTNAPHLLPGSRTGHKYGTAGLLDSVAHDGLTDADTGESMGLLTEQGNVERSLKRAEQDQAAAASHQRAAAAQEDGIFADEIVPTEIPQRKGDPVKVSADEGVRADATAESLGKLRPAFSQDDDASVTAGNSSPLTDGAAVVIVTSRAYAEEHGLQILASISGAGQVAGPDTSLHSQPSNAIKAALSKAGWTADELDFIEINEAFGAVVCQSLADLDYPLEKTNIHGGAIALGHPIGASGARLALTAAYELSRRGEGKAAVSLCGGGGQGDALLLSR
ncbi:acetyl-CoA C-acetyltransferase [Kocuria palustris]|jgi:acetyl-CoA C-acetyltransferase|uniref:acetyl-CoA C-acetyltransferase n=1 Tax=Kocuria palustris TaxID=71999 RepID=UPI0019CF697D|nr:acetyl-CoA C-acetyltransferase [Kocuria palustris]MBN6753350.1 acetyl-CoA C-acetyltransferase [Kocuria palustris]MBN6758135.1 acetyl-CoA C-acetyltransferase [Kocuria palustris]MBN6763163.1 acetyl-CoA C-acetyltransferase [Kocuria palustris]MBN6782855.1 acetyl-CoA C-acetyltransferase [Kocuria palustris]MBN6798992.1 acetyl-CoA C-acetyltransferase [Kocuria palustris]